MESLAMNLSDDAPTISLIVLVIAAVSMLASFYPGWGLWGLDTPKIFSVWIRILLFAFIVLFALPRIGPTIGRKIGDLAVSLRNNQLGYIYFIIVAILAALFIIFTSRNFFLGDGYGVQGNIKNGMYISPNEPLDYLIHFIIYKLSGATDTAIYWSYAITSYLCGISFFVGLYFIIRNKLNLLLSLGVILCFASVQFFFGYVESYTFRFVFMFFYSYSAINDLKANQISAGTILWLCLSIAFHLSGAILVPSAIYLAINRFSKRQKSIILVSCLMAGIAAGIIYLNMVSKITPFQILIPLFNTTTNPYYLFSGQHIKDIINLTLLVYPLAILILTNGNLRKMLLQPINYLLIGPAVLFAIFIDPSLGACRDWDMLSLAAAPILAFLIQAFFSGDKKWNPTAYATFAALGLFGILHTGGWVIQNDSMEKGYAMTKESVRHDIHYSRDYRQGKRNDAWMTSVNNYAHDAYEAVRASMESYHGNPDDTVNTYQLPGLLLRAGDTTAAAEMASENWIRFPGDVASITAFSWTLALCGQFDKAELISHHFLNDIGGHPRIYYGLSEIKKLRGQTDSSYYYLDKFYTLAQDTPIEGQFKFYLICYMSGDDQLAQAGFNRIKSHLPENFRLTAAKILITLNRGNPEEIESLRKEVSAIIQRSNN
jgi:hypothetical protein